MALPRLGCRIADISSAAGTVTATPSVGSYLLQASDNSWSPQSSPTLSVAVAAGATWSLSLPSHSDCLPSQLRWTISLPDGSQFTGAVTDKMVSDSQSSALATYDLQATHGWSSQPIGAATSSGVFQLRSTTPTIQWPGGASPNPTNALVMQPYGTNQSCQVMFAPSGTSTSCAIELFPTSTVANAQPNLALGVNVGSSRASTWVMNSNVYAQATSTSYDIGLMVSNGSGRTEALTVQASTGTVGINNTAPGSAQLSVKASAAANIGTVIQGAASQTADLLQLQNSAGNAQFGVMNAGTGGAPIWALRVRATANAESMAQAHTAGAATGKAIQVFDDAGASIGWINLTA